MLDKTDATRLLTRIRRQWFAKRKSIAAILKEVMTNEQSSLVDTDAANKAADADMALQELGADVAGEAYVTASLIVWDADPRRADEKLRLVMSNDETHGTDKNLMAKITKYISKDHGEKVGVIKNRLRRYKPEDVVKALEKMEAAGMARRETTKAKNNGKVSERWYFTG